VTQGVGTVFGDLRLWGGTTFRKIDPFGWRLAAAASKAQRCPSRTNSQNEAHMKRCEWAEPFLDQFVHHSACILTPSPLALIVECLHTGSGQHADRHTAADASTPWQCPSRKACSSERLPGTVPRLQATKSAHFMINQAMPTHSD
jgi:hypothetical protein